MHRPITSSPTPYSAATQQTSRSVAESVSSSPSDTSTKTIASEALTPPSDQSDVTPHADYAFPREPVHFPGGAEANEPRNAGAAEIIRNIVAAFIAPSDSLSPVIEQNQKDFEERRVPQKQEQVEVDTAASDKKHQD